MDYIVGVLVGIIIGAIAKPMIVKLFNIGVKALDKQVDNLDDKV